MPKAAITKKTVSKKAAQPLKKASKPAAQSPTASKNAPFGGLAARNGTGPLWKFTDAQDGSFIVPNADYISALYFPLFNEAGMKCSITPEFKGDTCRSFTNFLSIPSVTEDFHLSKASRNFWVYMEGLPAWSTTGVSALKTSSMWDSSPEDATVHAGIGWFSTIRTNRKMGLCAEATVFVPSNNDMVEVMQVTITNTGKKPVTFVPTSASPIFGRSADNIRDHRQVTSMFNEIEIAPFGVITKARILHDEHGHRPNTTQYATFACSEKGEQPKEIWSNQKEFIGEGGSLDNPESVARNLKAPKIGTFLKDGVETIAGLRFAKATLVPGASKSYIIIRSISDDRDYFDTMIKKYGSKSAFDEYLEETSAYWNDLIGRISYTTGNSDFDNWMRWVVFQPFCRKIYGNSYLPDHDYGRGGRGWRDLWSDLLALFLVDPSSTRSDIINNLHGIRIDGTNATIIGSKPGDFVADRNNVVRTWCDHGTWPYFVVDFYLNQTGDYDLLFKEITYFKDKFSHRSKKIDEAYTTSMGNFQKDTHSEVYKGTILEHILIQQLSSFFNVGIHNNLLLGGGDWNDTYDMARDKGESVCFYNWFGMNLHCIAQVLDHLANNGHPSISLLEEIKILLDSLPGQTKINYESVSAKHALLNTYFDTLASSVSGIKAAIPTKELAKDLRRKADHIFEHIRSKEYVTTAEGFSFFNGHYDNDSVRVHGDHKNGVRIDLTSQVLATMCGTANQDQVVETFRSINKYLKNKKTGGLSLCSDFGEVKLNFGRVTGFAFGWREHGSIWSQMNVMYLYALYSRNCVEEGYSVLKDLIILSIKSEQNRVFPNIPSCFQLNGKGMSNYLTGSPTWLVLAMTSLVFGVRGNAGNLCINPKLKKEQFSKDGIASTTFNFHDKTVALTYVNKKKLEWDKYEICSATCNGTDLLRKEGSAKNMLLVDKNDFIALCNQLVNEIIVILA